MRSTILRLPALLLVVLLSVLLLVACNNGDAGSSTTGSADTTASQNPPEDTTVPEETTTVSTETTESPVETTATPDETTAAPEETTTALDETTSGEDQPSVYVPRDKDAEYKVLFIGNSFTQYNNMPSNIFLPIAKAAGYTNVHVTAITNGGQYLTGFADPNDEYGQRVKSALESTKYDIVIVQEQSHCPVSSPLKFYNAAAKLCEMIKENGAELYFYATWGYDERHEDIGLYGPTTEAMEMRLRTAYTATAERLGVNVAYAGAGMTYALKNSSMTLYQNDYFHPSYAGSHIAALTLFSTIFGVDPATIDYQGRLTVEELENVRAAARYASSGELTIDEAEKASFIKIIDGGGFSSGVDITKTVLLKEAPQSDIISYLTSKTPMTGAGWRADYSDPSTYFSGIRGDKDEIASIAYSPTSLTEEQKRDIADIGYGVSVIGIDRMDSSKKGYTTAVQNLCNGHWGSTMMAAMFFDKDHYDISGNVSEDSKYTALITLNFGSVHQFDAIGYCSGSTLGFPQAQDVYVSDDGITWTKVESACYDVISMEASGTGLSSISQRPADPWKANTSKVEVLFSMEGYSGKYIRIGVILGGDVNTVGQTILTTLEYQQINTREIMVYGTKSN